MDKIIAGLNKEKRRDALIEKWIRNAEKIIPLLVIFGVVALLVANILRW